MTAADPDAITALLDRLPVAAVEPPRPAGDDVVDTRLARVRLLISRHLLATRPGELVPAIAAPPLAALLGAAPPSQVVALELERLGARLAAPAPRSRFEARLVAAFDLTGSELDALWVLAAAELSPRAMALLDAVVGVRTEGALPTSFVRHLVAGERSCELHLDDGALDRHGLIEPAGRGAVRITARALELLTGPHAEALPLEGVIAVTTPLPPAIPSITALAAHARQHGDRLLVVAPPGAGVRALAQAIAAGRPVLELDLAALGRAGASAAAALIREVRLADAVLLVRAADAARDQPRARLAALETALQRAGSALVIDAGRELNASSWWFAAALGARRVALSSPPPGERHALWLDALTAAGASGTVARTLAAELAPVTVGIDHVIDAIQLVTGSGPLEREALLTALEVLAGPRQATPLRFGLPATGLR